MTILDASRSVLRGVQIDSELELDDGVEGAGTGYTASGDNVAQVGGSNGYVDLFVGSNSDANSLYTIDVVVNVTSADRTTGDETYTITIEESDTSAFTVVRKTTAEALLVSDTTDVENAQWIKRLRPDWQYIRLNYVIAGTTRVLKVSKAGISPVTTNSL